MSAAIDNCNLKTACVERAQPNHIIHKIGGYRKMRNKGHSLIDDYVGEHEFNVKRCPMARKSNGKFRKCISSDCQWWQWKAKNCALPLICYNIGVLQMNISKSLRGISQ